MKAILLTIALLCLSSVSAASTYFLLLDGESAISYSLDFSSIHVSTAGLIFATVLFVVGTFGRKKKKLAKNSTIVGAFARSS